MNPLSLGMGSVKSEEMNYIFLYLDNVYPAGAKAVRDYIAEQPATMPTLELKSKIYEQFNAVITYLCTQKLAEGGNKVRILYRDLKPLIENLGSGTVDVVTTFLGNCEVAQIYGNMLKQDIAKTLRTLFRKFVSGDELKLLNNEIKGINVIDWKKFPSALVVSDKAFKCESIADKLTEINCLKEFIER